MSAVGSPPLLYQWYKNDTELPTATEPKFQIPSVQPTDSGNYSVVVSNKNGSVTSEKAVIQVVPIPEAEMVIPPSFATVEANGATANLSVRSREQTIYDKSLFGPNPIVITHLRFRQDRTISGIPEGLSAMVSNLQVRLSTSARPTGSMSGTFSENTGSDEKLCFQGDWAIYTKGINPPSGVPEPFDLILYLQQPFSYDPALGNLLLDMKNPTLAKIFVGLDAGTVQGLVQRRFVEDPNGLTSGGGDSSGPVIKLGYSLARIAPRIHTQPVAVNSMQTSNATFMVFASGYAPLGYQWYQDANPVPGATSPTLNFQNLLLSQAGSYSVVVSNEFGQAVSQPVILTVVPRPPRRALATAQIVNGYLVGITLLDGGFGYTNPPLVKIVGGGGSGAAANAIVNNGVVIGFEVLDVGKGYTGSTSIRVASPPRLPTLAIKVKTVTVGLKLNMGKSYQLQSSRDLTTWSPLGQVFVADEDEMSLDFNVSESGQYFRVDELP